MNPAKQARKDARIAAGGRRNAGAQRLNKYQLAKAKETAESRAIVVHRRMIGIS